MAEKAAFVASLSAGKQASTTTDNGGDIFYLAFKSQYIAIAQHNLC